ncbi:MAG: EndoU domain-containing protein [Oligoflexia bacterium]|nr:EndoU domain-containing protein [Oligoflexia bacterium]
MQGRNAIYLLAFWAAIYGTSAFAADQCLPFFDRSDEKVVTNVIQEDGTLQRGEIDITPEPMTVDSLDQEALKACGEFGAKVSVADVRKVIDRLSPDRVKELAADLPGTNDSELRELLVRAWTGSNGFEHVFCGQPSAKKVGGLHFGPRYHELQEKGQLCRLGDNVANEEVLPQSIFTIGVTTAVTTDRKKGFSVNQNAEDILFEASRDYIRGCRPSSPTRERRVCLSQSHDGDSFVSLFVCVPNVGITTFYPLATRAGRNYPNCR